MPNNKQIEEQLQRILESDRFKNSGRLSDFLSYVVKKAIKGENKTITGYNIGVDVFEKSHDFNSDTDSTVRVEAVRLRKTLSLYYHEEGKSDPVIITIPKGRYIPSFIENDMDRIEHVPASTAFSIARRVVFFATLALLLFTCSFIIYRAGGIKPHYLFTHSHSIQQPIIAIADFDVIGFQDNKRIKTDNAFRLHNKLSRFSDIRNFIITDPQTLEDASNDGNKLEFGYLLQGTIQRKGDKIDVSARLTDIDQQTATWRHSNIYDADTTGWMEDLTTTIISQLASTHGVIDSLEYGKHSENEKDMRSGYRCLLNFKIYDNHKSMEKHKSVKKCLERLSHRPPDSSITWAYLSWIYGDAIRHGYDLSEASKNNVKKRALDAALKAVELDPGDARAHMYLANAAMLNQNRDLALRHIEISLSLNPYNTGLLISAAWKYSHMGNWELNKKYAELAYKLHPSPPPEYDAALFNYYYNTGNSEKALYHALSYFQQDVVVSYYALIAAYQRAGQPDKAQKLASTVNKEFPQQLQNFDRMIQAWNITPDFFDKIRTDLEAAGLNIK